MMSSTLMVSKMKLKLNLVANTVIVIQKTWFRLSIMCGRLTVVAMKWVLEADLLVRLMTMLKSKAY